MTNTVPSSSARQDDSSLEAEGFGPLFLFGSSVDAGLLPCFNAGSPRRGFLQFQRGLRF